MSTTEMEVDGIIKGSTREETNGKHSRRSESRTSDRRDRDRDRERDRERDKDKDRDRRRPSDRDRDRDRDRDKDRDRYHDRERDRDRDYRPKRGYSRERDHDRDRDYRRDRDRDRERDRERDRDDRREKRPREDPDEGGPDAKRRKDDPAENGSTSGRRSEPRSERRDRSKDSDRRRRYDDSPRDYRRRDDRQPRRSPAPPPPPPPRRPSPSYAPPPDREQPEELDGDSEQRSVFVSQLAARLTARDLGYFFEEKLGDNTVIDARIVTDRLSRRSKGIGYVELRSLDLVPKAIALTGTIVMGLPVKVQLTEAERNRVHVGDVLNLPPGVTAPPGGPMQLYVGSLHFQLTESDIKQVFEPFGELEFVDLHRDPATGRSKGYCFIQYKKPEDAKMALEQMDGFELAGRTLRVNTVYEKGAGSGGGTNGRGLGSQAESLDEGGGNLNAVSRQALMQKLARTEQPTMKLPEIKRPVITQTMQTRCLLMTNMFDPAEETEPDWEKALADDVKVECESKYSGKVEYIKVDKESDRGEIYIQFDSVDAAGRALQDLNGRWFGGRQISATYISDAMMKAHM